MARTCRSPGAEIARRATAPLEAFVHPAFLAAAVALLSFPSPALAMHLDEGMLPLGWAALWWAVALVALAVGLGRLRARSRRDAIARPLTATMAALIFVLSSIPIPVPVAGSSSHACGTGLAAVVIGPSATFLASFVSLLLQALVEGHGGLSTLGANAVSMGLAGVLAGWGIFRLLRRAGASLPSAAAAAGLVADVATYATTALQLALAHRGDHPLAAATAAIGVAFLPVQLPIAILEAALAGGAVRLLQARRPQLLVRLGLLAPIPEAE